MLRKINIAALSVLVLCASLMAAQLQELKIVPSQSANGIIAAGDIVRIEWVRLTSAGSPIPAAVPPAGDIYYARTPAAGDLSKYTKVGSLLVSDSLAPFANVQKRHMSFIPGRQSGMGPGTFYCIVASVNGADTLYSDYFTLMVESATAPALISPKANIMSGEREAVISQLTPTFRWRAVSGVPYYHIILSDEPIVNMAGSSPSLNNNINVIWQAITPSSSIAYGAPDPSGTVTARPPPLSPGKTYSWMVLNNYGNHMAFSSNVYDAMDLVTGQFRIEGTPIDAPRVISPARNSVFSHILSPSIEFKWTDLDTRANSYLVNLFSDADPHDLGVGGLGELSANVLVWEKTVVRGNSGRYDTLSAVIDAAGTLTGGVYTLRVYAIDSRGAGSTAAQSVTNFRYYADAGNVSLKAIEVLGGIESPVGFAELRTEVLSGPMQAPLAFVTNASGVAARPFPAGRYRITAVKDGYNTQVVTVNVEAARTASAQIYMTRAEAVLFGRVVLADGSAISQARVTAVSEWGDTLTAFTSGSGGFTMSGRAARWTITIDRAGYRTTSPRRVTLSVGDNRDFGSIVMERNPFALSGVVRNAAGGPIMGSKVRVLRNGVLVEELVSTPQNGAYVFYLTSGNYTLTAEKPGFAMFSRSVGITTTREMDIALREGAVQVNGVVTGKSWDAERNGSNGGFVVAPIPSAVVKFWEEGENVRDTLVVISDATFGRFTIGLPPGKRYSVRAEASGFALSGAAGGLSTEGFGDGGGTLEFTDTLTAFMMIKGVVRADAGGAFLENADVMLYDMSSRVIAAARSSAAGAYELRNIPTSGRFIVGVGLNRYYMVNAPHIIEVDGGRPRVNSVSYDFTMAVGDKAVVWDVVGYAGRGVVKVMAPFSRAIPFEYSAPGIPITPAGLPEVGPGEYLIEAVAESNPNLLELSNHRFIVPVSAVPGVPVVDAVYFPFEHVSPETLKLDDGWYRLNVTSPAPQLPASIESIVLYHRSEGSARFLSDSLQMQVGVPMSIRFKPERDGVNLYYYIRVYLSNGDIYGSPKQLFRSYVKPDDRFITRITVEPGATGEDTLFMPSSYAAQFTFGAFYSDRFIPINITGGNAVNIGTIGWQLIDVADGAVVASGDGATFSYTTPAGAREMLLRAQLTAAEYYNVSANVVEIPIKVTGASLERMSVQRRGVAGPIASSEEVGFRIEAVDSDGRPVTVSSRWSVTPAGAGTISADGTFRPASGFFGTARVAVTAGGRSAEYMEDGAAAPGQSVYYTLRHRESGSDTASTKMGLSLIFAAGSVPAGSDVQFEASVPELKNYVQRGSDEFRMADSIAFDLSSDKYQIINGAVIMMFDIPEHLRSEVRNKNHDFRIAKWYSDSLKWIPIAGSEFVNNGTAIIVRLSNGEEAQSAQNRRRAARGKRAVTAAADRAALLGAYGRYALVTKTGKLDVSMSVSPHPFSPYIRPVKEHGAGAQFGTCINVKVEAPSGSVKSVKVHIYNSTGTRVWAVEKLNAPTGENRNRFWWNGRTSGRGNGRTAVSEEVWSEGFDNSNRPMLRNGRYFVTVIVTDVNGEQKRLMKPVVLMK
ncbi:MAG: carboxypeptidase-like regulatory domain-containing protein [Chitinispirillia bacterium]|nr:carboxypeptidase-like regulatory domain-containing protein [Chitinispirillia bacterium]